LSFWKRLFGSQSPSSSPTPPSSTSRTQGPILSTGDHELMEAVSAFIDRTFNAEPLVNHEIISPLVHVDIWCVPPASDRPWVTMLTSGMAERAMPPHPKFDGYPRIELVIAVPPDWPISAEPGALANRTWPLHLLREIARYPHVMGKPLGLGHTLEAPALANNDLGYSAVMLGAPSVFGDGNVRFKVRGQEVVFLSVIPLFPSELAFARHAGPAALWERLLPVEVPELVGRREPQV
jgi:hypothetical protein